MPETSFPHPPGVAQLPFEQGALSIPVFLSLWIHQTLSMHVRQTPTQGSGIGYLCLADRTGLLTLLSFIDWVPDAVTNISSPHGAPTETWLWGYSRWTPTSYISQQ